MPFTCPACIFRLPAQDGYVTYAEANCFLSYVAPLLTAQERETALKAHDDVMVFDLTLRQTVSAHGREAFVAMLAETLDGLPRESVVQGANKYTRPLNHTYHRLSSGSNLTLAPMP